VIAYVASTSFQTEREYRLTPGQTVRIEGHTLTYEGSTARIESNKNVIAANIRVDGSKVYAPSLRTFANGTQAIGTPSVRTSLVDDVYLSLLTAPESGDAVTMRVIIEPLAVWMWIGGGVIGFGALLAAFPGKRRRDPLEPVSARVGEATPEPEADAVPAGVD
jgi:cytochrome c-type biogenesis protein CcmF